MLKIAGILIIAIIIIALEIPYLKSEKLTKEIWVFSFLLLISVGLSIALSLKLDIPNPVEGITFIFKPFSKFIYDYLLN